MSDTQSDRSVLPFPAELRLKIYRNLVKKTYLALGTTPEHYFSAKKGNPKPLTPSAGLVILRVSKATSAEALQLLYEESVFLFKVDFTTGFLCDAPPQRAVAMMNNVSIEISAENSAFFAKKAEFVPCAYSLGEPKGPTSVELMSERTIELFTGTACFRNVMRVKFMDCTSQTYYSQQMGFRDAINDLAGFRKLVVELESPHNLGSDKPWLTSEQARAVCEKQSENLDDGYVFELTFGPAVQGTEYGACYYTCYLEFYPRQQLAKDLIVKAAKMHEEADKMLEEAARVAPGERAAASLPGLAETLKLL